MHRQHNTHALYRADISLARTHALALTLAAAVAVAVALALAVAVAVAFALAFTLALTLSLALTLALAQATRVGTAKWESMNEEPWMQVNPSTLPNHRFILEHSQATDPATCPLVPHFTSIL